MRKAERDLSRGLDKENKKEPAPKRRKTATPKEKGVPKKTPSSKSREPLGTIQVPDFELGPPAPGIQPPTATKTVPSPPKAIPSPHDDQNMSMSISSSEEMLPKGTVEKVSYSLTLLIHQTCIPHCF